MKCPVCFASQESIPNEKVHVCPYCDSILIPYENGYRTVDQFPWWIKKNFDLGNKVGIVITEKRILFFSYGKNWILNDKYVLENNIENNAEKNEKVTYIYGSIPIFTLPGQSISIVENEGIKIYHQKGLAIFNPI